MMILASSDTDAVRIKHILHSINLQIMAQEIADPSLLKGLSGDVLCSWYTRKVDPSLVDSQYLENAITRLQDSAASVRTAGDLSDGITGVAWLFELLLAESDDPYPPAFNQNVDAFLGRVASGDGWNGELEYVMGLSGIAAYAARRGRQCGDHALYAKVIGAFERHAQWTGSLCTWATPEESMFLLEEDLHDPQAKQYNLGLAHGIPGIIAALIPALHVAELAPSAGRLITGACDWLLRQARDPARCGSYFGSLAGEETRSRLGWCYGDIPIALTLMRAGKSLDRLDWIAFADTVATHAARRGAQDGLVWDAGLCHGSAGLFLLFQLLHQHHPNPACKEAATFWLDDVLDRFDREGIHGLDTFRRDEKTGEPYYLPLKDFLSGYGGIALCLTVAMGVTPHWIDGILLG